MPRYNVEHKGKWACFSSVVDDFITWFMPKTDYEIWRKEEYGKDYSPVEMCNRTDIDNAAFSIRLNRSHDEAMQCLIDSGLSKDECKKIMTTMEKKHYAPRLKSDGRYHCPNCDDEIELNQKSCINDTCYLDFVWM